MVEGWLCHGCDLGRCSSYQPDIHLMNCRDGEDSGMQSVLGGRVD